MRRYIANDRIVPNELTAANVDAPARATHVVTDTNPTAPTDLEVGCDAGTVVIDGNEVSVSAQTESVSDISGEVTETAYRYHTLSVDATGALVVRSSDVGEFDATDPDAEPITQVTEPSHETGEVFLGTAFQVDGAVERVFDGRYFGSPIPSGVITMWSGAIGDIPGGWTLCDGTDGTPDLTDRFVAGAGGQYSVGDTGGEDEHTLTEAETPSHVHTGSTNTDGAHTHDSEQSGDRRGYVNRGAGNEAPPGGAGTDTGYDDEIRATGSAHSHEFTTDPFGDDQPHENRPPYYALAYIMKI